MDNRVELLVDSISKLRILSPTQEDKNNVKSNINKFFSSEAKCSEFIYTKNMDKLPFGCIVFPVFDEEDVYKIFMTTEPVRANEYQVELDSKMFDYGLTDEEIAMMILFNVYHLINDTKPYDVVKYAIDDILTDSVSIMERTKAMAFIKILEFGLVDALNQVTSCLSLPNDVVSDPYLESLGLYDFKEMLDKVYYQIPGCDNEASRQPRLSMLEWALRSYKNIDTDRSVISRLMLKCKDLTASVLYNRKYDSIINCVNREEPKYDAVDMITKNILTESNKKIGLVSRLKYNGLRDIENDLYEFHIRATNAENETDVMYALKQINARLAILDDYIRENPDDDEIDRWLSVKMEYIDIRDILARKKLHKKNYGIFVDYDQIFSNDDE